MTTKEIVKALRVRAETQNKRGYSGEASELVHLADLIESQATEIAAYKDTGLTPGDIKDLQGLCEKNGLAKYVDLIVEAKRQMGISNEREDEQDERIEQLETQLAALRADNRDMCTEWKAAHEELGKLRKWLADYRTGTKRLKKRIARLQDERDRAQMEKYQADEVLSKAERRERAMIEDMKEMALAMRESEELPEGCCFACICDAQNLPDNVILAYRECPGYDRNDCFEWRGAQEGEER